MTMIESPKTKTPRANRRQFLKGAAGSALGLTIGFTWIGRGNGRFAEAAAGNLAPNAFLRITPDGTVTVIAKHMEMGQGAYTGIATMVAEELDADWSRVKVESAPADASRYANSLLGIQGTGGSTAMANSWQQLRQAGATARAMLVAAAAAQWGVPASTITVEQGVVRHGPSKRQSGFGELVQAAAALPVPESVPLKDPKTFKLIGREHLPRIDTPEKINGTAMFTIDVRLPGMLTAVIRRPPQFGATVKSFDATAAKAVPGVVGVVQVPAGVAVVANGFWAAKKGRDALAVDWDTTKAELRSSDALMASYKELAKQPGATARKTGDVDAVLPKAAKTVASSFEFPYLAHAPMEPVNCVVKLSADVCEIWAGHQLQTIDQGVAAAVAGVKPEQVVLHTLYAGGSFGRRANGTADFVAEGVSIAKAMGANGVPIRLQWTREDDIQGGLYRPMYYHTLEAGIDAKGKLVAWKHRIVGQSIIAGTPFEPFLIKEGIDDTSVEGASTLPYAISNLQVELHTTKVGVPVLWWRSVGSTHTAYATETFLDEIAKEMGKDPVVLRRELLKAEPRHLGVLNLAAEKAGWSKPLGKGKARGIAVHKSFGSYVAQVAEIAQDKDGQIRVDRVVCAVDCGIAINPDIIRAQVEGGVGYGLGAIMTGAITLDKGTVDQSNFDGYTVLRIDRMPKVEVHILRSTQPPTGIGEPGVPPIGPAVANAIFALTGKRHRILPFSAEGSA